MPHIRLNDIPWLEQHSPTRKFHSSARNISVALGCPRNAGTWGGGHPFDVQLRRIPAGAAVCPHHSHLAQWEFFLVHRGTGTVRAGDERHAVKPGDFLVHPPGEAHQLTNSGADELEVLIVADNPMLDACYYPDSNKWGLRPPGKFFRMHEVDYFAGEDVDESVSSGYQPSGSPPSPPLSPFPQRCRNLADLPWDEWTSPKRRFRGTSKELSIALGALRNTPIGLGGHPFDVEYSKLLPGECGCPFHSHAAQWELFYLLEGTAKVRAGGETLTLNAGDICLHPPGEPHQITNASATHDLLFYLIADNPPADYWFYPDSGKWGLRQPRMFFRPQQVEYYDGEE